MSSVPPEATPATSGWRIARTAVRWTGALVLAAWSLLLLAWLTLHWGILPHIDEWRPQIEQRASAALGATVRIGRIEVRSGGWVPALELKDVSVVDANGREALRLPRVAAAVSPQTLFAFELRFEQLLIEAPELEVRRDALGRVFVAGLEFGGPSAGDDGRAADWFFAQHEFVIRGGRLRWVDEKRITPPLELTDVLLVVRNGLRRHELRVDATPPPDWGDRFTVTGRFTQSLLARTGDWQRWSGTLHADLPRADVRELRRHLDLPFDLYEGAGSLRAWLEFERGTPRGATVDLALADVSLRLAPALAPLGFERIEGRLAAQRDDEGVTLSAERFGFRSAEGLEWPHGQVTLGWRQHDGGPVTGGRLEADRIDLALVAAVAERVPIGDALRELLAELAPRGVISGLGARWDGPLDAPQRYEARAKLRGLSLAAKPSTEPGGVGRPGLSNADLDLSANERGGSASLVIRDGALEFPGVFEQPSVALDSFDAQLGWRIEARRGADAAAPRIELQVRNARFANADAKGELNATWSTGPGAGLARGGRLPGQLDLAGKLERGLAASTARYLPLGIPEPARRYVERAVKGGQVAAATFKVKGDLWDFPFYNAKQGEFRIAGKMQDVSFDYVPSVAPGGDEPAWESPWPGFTKLSGDLVFDRVSMEIRNASARLWGFDLVGVNGGIRDFLNQPTLALDGGGRGPLADALRFVNATPIGEWTGGALARASASGNTELKLALRVPLHDTARTTVQGSVQLAGNDVRLRPDTPLLANARARVEFSHKGFSISGGAARVLGGDATFDGGTQPDGSLRFSGQGTATAEGLRRATEFGLLAKLAPSLSGQTPYRVSLAITRGLPEITVTSNLVGLASHLPAPLAKSAEAPLPMRYQTTLVADAPAGSVRDTLRFELGSLVQAQYLRELSKDVPTVLRGGIGVLDAMPVPSAGVQASLNLGAVNADAWESVADKLFEAGAAELGEGGYAPTQIALRAQEIVAESRRLTRLVAGLSLADGVWRANLEADQLSGYAEWRPARGAAAGRVYARLARLSLPKAEAEGVESLLDAGSANVPALDIVIDDFELRGKKLGRIEIEAASRGDAARDAREWRLSRLAMVTPEAQLSASGQWINTAAARRRSSLNFRLDLADSGAFLERLGFGKAMRGGKGRLTGQVAWNGSPLAFDLASLSGDVNVALDAGQFLKADPGAARLLGVLNLQALPRRLALDFRDVFQEGFPFDSITGDVKVAQGVAQTNNLRMRGVQAAVLMEGSADLNRETQDLRVIVVPEINAGTASLAYAVINPAVGLGTFLAQMFLRRPMMQAVTREFRVTGSWADPQVARVERKFSDPLPDDTAAAPPPAPTTRTP